MCGCLTLWQAALRLLKLHLVVLAANVILLRAVLAGRHVGSFIHIQLNFNMFTIAPSAD